MTTKQGRPISDFAKHGYASDLNDLDYKAALKIFCLRRSNDIRKSFGGDLPFDLLLARVYMQGLIDMRTNNET